MWKTELLGFIIENVGTIFLVSNKTLNLFFLIWLMYNYYEYMGRNPPKTMDRHFAIVNKHLITKL